MRKWFNNHSYLLIPSIIGAAIIWLGVYGVSHAATTPRHYIVWSISKTVDMCPYSRHTLCIQRNLNALSEGGYRLVTVSGDNVYEVRP